MPELVINPLWGFGLFNELNQPVIHFNSDNSGVIFENNTNHSGDGEIKFSATIPSLKPGEYLLAIGLDDGVPGNSEVLIHIYDALKINVESDDISPQAGYIRIENCKVINK